MQITHMPQVPLRNSMPGLHPHGQALPVRVQVQRSSLTLFLFSRPFLIGCSAVLCHLPSQVWRVDVSTRHFFLSLAPAPVLLISYCICRRSFD